MKSEEQTTSVQPTTATSTPTQSYQAPQWTSGPMAIDPILQQQSVQQQSTTTTTAYPHYPYTSHYPQAAYASHYSYTSPQSSTTATTTATTGQTQPLQASSSTSQPTRQYSTNTYNATASANASNGMDTADIATLNDALGSAGVDLRAEEESLQRSHDTHQSYRSYEDRTRKQAPKPSFDTRFLGTTMRTIGTQHKVTRIPEESVNYLALALRARLQDLITAMIAASHHRTDTQFDRPASFYEDGSPMWSIVVRSDVAKQLAALEKIEREEETKIRKERKERAEMTAAHAAALQAQANGMAGNQSMDIGMDDSEGGAKKKRKKDGPGVTARNMSEDVRKKMSNAVATQAAGLGGRYSWMTAANASAPQQKAKPAVTTTTTTTATPAGTTTGTTPFAATTGVTTTSTTITPAAASTTSTTTATAAAAAAATAAAAASASSWARPYVPTKKSSSLLPTQTSTEEDTRTSVTMRDAMFVIEKERGHGGGRGAARGWV